MCSSVPGSVEDSTSTGPRVARSSVAASSTEVLSNGGGPASTRPDGSSSCVTRSSGSSPTAPADVLDGDAATVSARSCRLVETDRSSSR